MKIKNHSSSELDILEFLSTPSSEEEILLEKSIISKITNFQQTMEKLEEDHINQKIPLLQTLRASLSQSLKRDPKEIASWNKAQLFLNECLAQQRNCSWEMICQLHQLLRPQTEKNCMRDREVYTGANSHPHPYDLPVLVKEMLKEFERVSQEKHPLYAALHLRYWILSIHPFLDANGRTSQLAADYVLLKAGFLPQSYYNLGEGRLIGLPSQKSYMGPHQAFKIFTMTIINSYSIFLS